jgi:hypothetical protein
MSDTTGPVLAIGGITLANKSLLHAEPFDWRIAIATGISAGLFALLERAWHDGAVALAWMALVTILLVRVDPKTPAPMESLNSWLKKGGNA